MVAGEHAAVRIFRGRWLSGPAARALESTADRCLEDASGRAARFYAPRYQLSAASGCGARSRRTCRAAVAAGVPLCADPPGCVLEPDRGGTRTVRDGRTGLADRCRGAGRQT